MTESTNAAVTPSTEPQVLVEVIATSDRQIRNKPKINEALADRQGEILAALAQTQALLQSVQTSQVNGGPRVSEIQASFGISLKAEAGVFVGKASAEATFDIQMTVSFD